MSGLYGDFVVAATDAASIAAGGSVTYEAAVYGFPTKTTTPAVDGSIPAITSSCPGALRPHGWPRRAPG